MRNCRPSGVSTMATHTAHVDTVTCYHTFHPSPANSPAVYNISLHRHSNRGLHRVCINPQSEFTSSGVYKPAGLITKKSKQPAMLVMSRCWPSRSVGTRLAMESTLAQLWDDVDILALVVDAGDLQSVSRWTQANWNTERSWRADDRRTKTIKHASPAWIPIPDHENPTQLLL